MIDAGLPLVQCLEILAQQQDNKYFQQILLQVRQDVEEGSTLAAAMARHPRVFDQLYANMVEAGETGGILDLILQRLSTFIEKIVKLKRDIISAMIYPTAVILMAIGAVAVIMIVVIPQFQNIFLGLLGPGEQLPLPTRIVVGISNFLAGWGGLAMLATIIGSAVAIKFYYKTPGGRKTSIGCCSRYRFSATSFARSPWPGFRERFRRCCLPVFRFCSRWTSLQDFRQRDHRRSDHESSNRC
jgi:type IV pilus assembly protein PilC